MTDESDRIEEALRERLGAGATLDAARRQALLEKILAAPAAPARPPRRAVGWSLAAAVAAVAAAAVLAVAVWPRPQPEPIHPTDLFADLLGPLVPAPPSSETPPPAPAVPGAAVEDALARLHSEFEGPVPFGQALLQGPLAGTPWGRPADRAANPQKGDPR